jgi:hypothetical protein
MAGEFDEAERLGREAMALGEQTGSGNAVLLGLIQRWCALVDEGRVDDALVAFGEIGLDGLESTAVVIARALNLVVAGRPAEARTVFDPIADRIPDVPVDAEWLPLMCQVAVIVDCIGGHPAAAWTYDALLPYGDQFAVEGIGAWCRGCTAEYLGLLALALGRPADADRHLAAAVAADEAAATFAARRAAGRCSPAAAPAVFRRAGEVWELAWGGTEVRVRDRKGLRDLARLLASPGREIAALDLAGTAVVEGDGDAVLDRTAREAYAARLRELEAELDESDRHTDTARSERLAAERDALLEQLSAAYGLGGRARRLGPRPPSGPGRR